MSVTKLTTYLGCGRRYRYRYLDRLEPERRSVNLGLGTVVHSTIAWWQEQRMAGVDVGSDELALVFAADWQAELDEPMLDLEGKDPTNVAGLGMGLVDLFVNNDIAVPDAVEQRIECELPGGVPFVGYLDYRRGSVLGEVKTTARKASAANWGLQLSGYAYAFEQVHGVVPTVELVQLVKTRTPQVHVEEVTIDDREVAWFLEVASEVHQAVKAGAFPPSPSWMCKGCEYRRACRG